MSKSKDFRYVGRFAPSPTGPLHAGSMACALASWLDARAHGGKWLVRIEDVDTPRCLPGTDRIILGQLADCGLHSDDLLVYQSRRGPQYQAALSQLVAQGLAYACGCSRQDIEAAVDAAGGFRARGLALIYPGTCRHGLAGKAVRSWRFRTGSTRNSESNKPVAHIKRAQAAPEIIATCTVDWIDRALGPQHQNVEREIGDFVLRRADGLWAYQLAVVVDDAAQGVTHVVRGADLLDNTARQILLQRALGLPQPAYLHTPVVNGANGEKLSKQNGAIAVPTSNPLATLENAGAVLGITLSESQTSQWLAEATRCWAAKYRFHAL